LGLLSITTFEKSHVRRFINWENHTVVVIIARKHLFHSFILNFICSLILLVCEIVKVILTLY